MRYGLKLWLLALWVFPFGLWAGEEETQPKVTLLLNQPCEALGVTRERMGDFSVQTMAGTMIRNRRSMVQFMPDFPENVIVEFDWQVVMLWPTRNTRSTDQHRGSALWFGGKGVPVTFNWIHGEGFRFESLNISNFRCHLYVADPCDCDENE